MSRPISVHFDLHALSHNLQLARRRTRARILAVLKADGYGHGLLRVANALGEADGFALLDIEDAIRLREAGFRQPILLLEGFFSPDDVPLLAAYRLSTAIHSPWQLHCLDAYPERGTLDVWLKVNTGMNRLGWRGEQVDWAMQQLCQHRAVASVTLMNHFAHADEPRGVTEQLERFNQLAAPYRVPRSLANSAALLRHPASHADWVRAGVMLYGASPFADSSAEQLGLQPVMTLRSRIIALQTLNAGDEVGYGGIFRADRSMRIGVVACGYADGYPRHAPNGTPILVAGRRSHTVGRVSMDMLCVDLTHIPEADIGSPVVLWGQGMPIEEVARAAGTISYELMCGITKRVPVGN